MIKFFYRSVGGFGVLYRIEGRIAICSNSDASLYNAHTVVVTGYVFREKRRYYFITLSDTTFIAPRLSVISECNIEPCHESQFSWASV